jgi:hypothetical protein
MFMLIMSVTGDSIVIGFAERMNCPTEGDNTLCLGMSIIIR